MKSMIGNNQWVTVCDGCNRTIHIGNYVVDHDLCTHCINMGNIRDVLAKLADRETGKRVRQASAPTRPKIRFLAPTFP